MAKPTRRRPRNDGSLRRRTQLRAPYRTFPLFCEGISTEPDYIEALGQERAGRDSASVEIRIDRTASGAIPLTLVRNAALARDRYFQGQGEIG